MQLSSLACLHNVSESTSLFRNRPIGGRDCLKMAKPNEDERLPQNWEENAAFVTDLWNKRKLETRRQAIEGVINILNDLVQNPPSQELCSRASPSTLRLGAVHFESFQPPTG